MDLQKLYPWNWFKHEEASATGTVPVKRGELLTASHSPSRDVDEQHPLLLLQQQMDRLINAAMSGFGLPSSTNAGSHAHWGRMPAFQATVNVSSDDQSYHISVEAPGLTEKDIALELADGVLTITGEKKEESSSKDRHYYRVERRYGHFRRVLSLPDDGDVDSIQATMKNGVLDIALARKAVSAAHVKRIPVSG